MLGRVQVDPPQRERVAEYLHQLVGPADKYHPPRRTDNRGRDIGGVVLDGHRPRAGHLLPHLLGRHPDREADKHVVLRLGQDPAGGFELVEVGQHASERQHLPVDTQSTEIRVSYTIEKPGCRCLGILGQLGQPLLDGRDIPHLDDTGRAVTLTRRRQAQS